MRNLTILGLFYAIFCLISIFFIFYVVESGKCQMREKYNKQFQIETTPVECFKNLNYQK